MSDYLKAILMLLLFAGFGCAISTQEEDEEIPCVDSDEDGFYSECATATDCDDSDRTIYPGAPEVPDDGIDQNCTGVDMTIEVETVDTEGATYTSLEIDAQDRIHIAYCEWDEVIWGCSSLKYAVKDDSGWTTERIEGSGEVDWALSLALDSSSNAHICYTGRGYGLQYADNTNGNWRFEIVDEDTASGDFCQIAADDTDNLHIAYAQRRDEDLKYATGEYGNWNIETIGSEGSVGGHISFVLDEDGNAYIGHTDWAEDQLLFTSNKQGSWIQEVVESATFRCCSAIDLDQDSNVHMSYFSGAGLGYSVKNEESGVWTSEAIDAIPYTTIWWNSLKMDDQGVPHISYSDMETEQLGYVSNSNGDWFKLELDHYSPSVGDFNSLAIDSNGDIHISYSDWQNKAIKYAVIRDH